MNKTAQVISIILLSIVSLSAMPKTNRYLKTDIEASLDSAQFNINRISNYLTNDGNLSSSAITSDAGATWPAGKAYRIMFQSGIWFAGKTSSGDVRTACCEYDSEFLPGKILNDGSPDNPDNYKIYSIETDNTTSSDYLNWPAKDGAPVDDL